MDNRVEAIKFFNAGVAAVNDKSNPNHLMVGYQLFSSACHADSTWHEAWYQNGNNNSDLGKYEAAIANWRVALQCECSPEERAKTLVNIGWRLHSLGHTHEAFEHTMEALALAPHLANGWINLSLINVLLGNRLAMVAAARKAYALAPDDTNAEAALAFALLFNGDYQEGFRHFEIRFKWRLQNFTQFPYPKWEGQEQKTVMLISDQGLGDTLSFSRFVERAANKCQYLHLCIQPQLYRLFVNAFLHLPNVNVIPQPSPFPAADYWTTFVSLPFALGLTDEEVRSAPHITAPPVGMPQNWKVPGKKLHIGISWAGSPLNDIDKYRNIPVTQFFDLYRVPGIQLYGLQIGDKARELHDAGGAALIRDLSPYVSDVTDSLGLLRDLDLVICCESALGHIAALAGKEVWLPYSYQGRDYRIGLTGDQLLWTPKTRTFNQQQGETWAPVFGRIIEALQRRIADGVERPKEPERAEPRQRHRA